MKPLIQHFDALPSTNDKAMELLLLGSGEGTVVAASRQTAGRGQQGAAWESEAGKNLTFSLALCPRFLPAAQMFYLSKAVSLGVVDFLLTQKISAAIKWPNDVYVGNQKICGILIEQSVSGERIAQSVVGVGLNVNQKKFRRAPNAVSMLLCDDRVRPLDEALQLLVGCLLRRYRQLAAAFRAKDSSLALGRIDREYLALLYRRNGFFPYRRPGGEVFLAQILDVAPSGELLLQRKSGEVCRFWFKEVEVA